MRINRLTGLLLTLSILACALAQAQSPPGAGTLQQQIERERGPVIPAPGPAQRPSAATPSRLTPGGSITVSAFRFSGNTRLRDEQLAPVVAPYLNRPLDFTELQKVATDVADAYRSAGWIVRAYLPAQEVVNGVITIQVVESVLGRIIREGPEPQRIRQSQLDQILGAQQRRGELLNADAVDRALLLADDLPGISVAGALREGAAERETDLILKLGEEPAAIGELAADNAGSRSTGRNRLTANLNLNSPLGRGDLLAANAIHTVGSDYLRVDGTIPVGYDGWRLGANGSSLRYRLVAPEFIPLNAHGTASTFGLTATYPLIRSRARNLYLSSNLDYKTFENHAADTLSSRYSADTLTIGLEGNSFDTLGEGGANSAGLSLITGHLNLQGSPNEAADATTTRTAGAFSKLRYHVSRQQNISGDWVAYAALSGQFARKNLDSSEKFYLGGATSLRAYPAGEGGGTQGRLLNLELRWRFAEEFTLTGFYDHGTVTINRDNNFAGAAALNDYSLKGAGLSLSWQSGNVNLKGTWSHRIGDNPNPTATGNDQDGSLLKNRFWFLATIRF
jgi:hemolysin activation/secretion protein